MLRRKVGRRDGGGSELSAEAAARVAVAARVVAGPGAQTFTVTARLHYPEQTLTYVPGFWQLIKYNTV